MIYTRIILLFTFMVLAFPADAKDRLRTRTGDVLIYRHGLPVDVEIKDKKIIMRRIIKAFNKNTADTSSLWYKNEVERSGETLEDKWNTIKEGSYFSLVPQHKAPSNGAKKRTSSRGRSDMSEVVIEIIEESGRPFFGMALATFEDGEIRAYNIPGEWLTHVYCVDVAGKYIPSHYSILTEKYGSADYEDTALDCITMSKK
ncbi:MAG: hypothetical protein ACRBDL_05365 [Alphaproteobacteria bacterium]